MKKFKKEIGITIFDYLNKYRVNNSIKQINSSNDSLTKIALNNGFYSLEYFSEIFKKEIGVSPQKYKKIIISKYIYDDNYRFALTNIIKINKIIDFTQKYKSKRKIKFTPVMKLSIFNR